MQPIFLKRSPEKNTAFKVCRNADPYSHQTWHFHDEYEIAYVEKGGGTRFVGDSIEPYEAGDLVLLGANLPHEWKSDYTGDIKSDYSSRSLALYFLRDFPGKAFYALPEMEKINVLLRHSHRGVKVRDQRRKEIVHRKLCKMLHLTGVDKLMTLFSILEDIADAKESELLASQAFIDSYRNTRDLRINQVYKYINDHFKQDITLSELSAEINMTPNSFCRYFKKVTNKTPIEYLNEIRVAYACRLLVRGDKTISQCAFESGFNNLANFNRRFKIVNGQTPKEYIRKAQ